MLAGLSAMADIVLKNLSKQFGQTSVLKPLDLTINSGEFIVLLGPSGCGKSTTLRMIAGLESPSDGQILIDGNDVTNLAPKERDVAMVFQSYALYPHLTVRENMAFGLKVRKTPAETIAKEIEQASKLLDIEHLLDRKPKELSGGQRQRVAMGRAIVRRPKVFMFDEPLSNLDAALRAQMRTEIAALHAKLGITTVYVTHDQVEAMTLADRIVILHQGVLQQQGAPLEVYENPNNGFVGSFLGSPPMNLISAKIDGAGNLAINDARIGEEGKYAAHKDVHVFVGVRPQSFHIAENGALAGQIDLVEPLGGESVIRLRLEDQQKVTVQVAGLTSHKRGDQVRLDIKESEIHIFSDENGEAGGKLN
ncbi:MAG: ABC transporter ATP-binding protein [Myxococcota bacterium]|nr:ABC transporter ATP-binding protein [Myxococcota bacterium]